MTRNSDSSEKIYSSESYILLAWRHRCPPTPSLEISNKRRGETEAALLEFLFGRGLVLPRLVGVLGWEGGGKATALEITGSGKGREKGGGG